MQIFASLHNSISRIFFNSEAANKPTPNSTTSSSATATHSQGSMPGTGNPNHLSPPVPIFFLEPVEPRTDLLHDHQSSKSSFSIYPPSLQSSLVSSQPSERVVFQETKAKELLEVFTKGTKKNVDPETEKLIRNMRLPLEVGNLESEYEFNGFKCTFDLLNWFASSYTESIPEKNPVIKQIEINAYNGYITKLIDTHLLAPNVNTSDFDKIMQTMAQYPKFKRAILLAIKSKGGELSNLKNIVLENMDTIRKHRLNAIIIKMPGIPNSRQIKDHEKRKSELEQTQNNLYERTTRIIKMFNPGSSPRIIDSNTFEAEMNKILKAIKSQETDHNKPISEFLTITTLETSIAEPAVRLHNGQNLQKLLTLAINETGHPMTIEGMEKLIEKLGGTVPKYPTDTFSEEDKLNRLADSAKSKSDDLRAQINLKLWEDYGENKNNLLEKYIFNTSRTIYDPKYRKAEDKLFNSTMESNHEFNRGAADNAVKKKVKAEHLRSEAGKYNLVRDGKYMEKLGEALTHAIEAIVTTFIDQKRAEIEALFEGITEPMSYKVTNKDVVEDKEKKKVALEGIKNKIIEAIKKAANPKTDNKFVTIMQPWRELRGDELGPEQDSKKIEFACPKRETIENIVTMVDNLKKKIEAIETDHRYFKITESTTKTDPKDNKYIVKKTKIELDSTQIKDFFDTCNTLMNQLKAPEPKQSKPKENLSLPEILFGSIFEANKSDTKLPFFSSPSASSVGTPSVRSEASGSSVYNSQSAETGTGSSGPSSAQSDPNNFSFLASLLTNSSSGSSVSEGANSGKSVLDKFLGVFRIG